MKKRLLSMILALSMMLTILPVNAITALAADEDVVASGNCGIEGKDDNSVTWKLTKNDDGIENNTYTLTISGSGNMENFYDTNGSRRAPWRTSSNGYGANITQISFADGITSVGAKAFFGCSNLENIFIPDSVTRIASSAFEECSKLKSVTGFKYVTSIGSSAFSGCASLESIPFPVSRVSIGDYAFERCSSLKNVKIPDNVTSIGTTIFNRCGNIETVTLPCVLPRMPYNALAGAKHTYYPGTKQQLDAQRGQITESPDMFISSVQYYCDVTFDANGGGFNDTDSDKKIILKTWSGINLTKEQVESIGEPKKAGKKFIGWSTVSTPSSVATPLRLTTDIEAKIYDYRKTFYAMYRDVVPATIAINDSNKTFKAGTESNTFTITATKGDTEAAKVKFKFTNGTVQYKNNSTDWTDLTGNEISIDELNSVLFRIATNKNATVGTSTLTVELVTDQGTEIGVQNTADFTVTARTPAAVTITGPTNNAVKAGEPSQTFTMSITNHDDAVGKVTFDFDGEVQYADNTYSPNWTTVDKDNGVTRAIATGKYFRVVPKADAATGDMTLTAKLVDTDGNEITGATASTTFAVTARKPAEVTITGLDNTTVKAGEAKEFTVSVTPNDDSNTGAKATITVSGANANAVEKIQYKDGETWKDVPDEGLSIDEINNTEFKLITKADANNGDVTITVTAKKADGPEIDKKAAAVTVKKHENAAVTIDGLDGTTVKAGEAKEFTVNVTPNDDTIDKVTFGTTSGEVQWSNDGGKTWTTVSGDVDYSDLTGKQFRVVPAADAANGTVTVTVIAKADGTEAAKKDASFTVTKKEEPVTPGGGSTGGSENPGENPGSGSTTPKRKLEIADGTLTSVMVKDENGNLKDITDTITKDLDGKYEIPVGAKVTITAKDAPEGMKFGEWSISDKTLLSDPDVPYTEKDLIFTMPDNPDGVKLSVVYLEESIGEEPNLVEKGALAGTVVVGSAALLYQGHMLGTELYLRYLLPHGAIIPQNRAELAVLLWQDAENPEPVSTTLYSDISDEDSAIQQAARWAVENDLMEQLDAEEHPDHFDPFVPVTFSDSIRAWKKAQELKKSVH